MQDEPRLDELITAVAGFLRDQIAPQISGHAAFKLRVGINALDLVARQLTLAGDSDAEELARLRSLLGRSGSLMELNGELSSQIASGAVDLSTPGLKDHLWRTTLAKLAVDQPSYASYRREVDSSSSTSSSSS